MLVVVVPEESTVKSHGLFTYISSKDIWTIGEINIRTLYEHKVVFYMEKQPDKTSYIALDDLSLLSHRCQSPVSVLAWKLLLLP